MQKERIPETNEGIQGEFDVAEYELFLRTMRDRGWMETDAIVKFGINAGLALEVGPGPGYLGLEWLKKTTGTQLHGLEISENMIARAQKNRKEYGFDDTRVKYVHGNAMNMPLDDNRYDAVFSNGSLHEWENPGKIFNEIYRVLKPGGRYFISDLRRDSAVFIKWFLAATTQQKSRRGLKTSLQASYTIKEISEIINQTELKCANIKVNPIGLVICGTK